jgi:two-component system, OmpR family, response regulator RegX3
VRIALLEDDKGQTELYSTWLEGAGHVCSSFAAGKAFIKHMGRESYDLILLDWGIPDITGAEVLVWIRSHIQNPVPVMFVTARDEEQDIVAALESGADDYLVKPVRKMELLARINALERRAKQDFVQKETLDFNPFFIDVKARKVSRDNKAIDLTIKEFDFTLFLFRHLGQLLSRGHILESIWGRSRELSTRTVDTHASRIRHKLELGQESGYRLSAVYFYGYRLERIAPS